MKPFCFLETLLRASLFTLGALVLSHFAPLSAAEQVVLRVGYFPNVTHAQGVIGAHSTRQGQGWFEQRLGAGVKIEWYAYNAGPSAMEAIFSGAIDMTYVGPNPALNAYIRSKGREIRILSGSAQGGAALVLRKGVTVKSPADFKGLRLATPQLGNTQDVAARAWVKKQGFALTLTGGDVSVIPTANPDQFALMQAGKLDAAWTVEPWVSRLELEAGAVSYLEQKDAITTILVSSTKALSKQAELVERFVKAHEELTAWLAAHPEEAREKVRVGLTAEVKREISPVLVASAWKRLNFTTELARGQFDDLVKDAQSVGFLRDAIPLDKLFSRKP